MNNLWLSVILTFTLIIGGFGRVVSFNLITFGKEVTVTFNGKTLPMILVNDYAPVYSLSGICPDEEFE